MRQSADSLGDSDAFRALYESAKEAVFGFALSILKKTHDAEDAMQDTFLKIRGAAHLYVPQGKPCRRMRDFAGS